MMKTRTVVITGSARGLGYEMAKCFRKKNYNVVISDLNKKDIDKAKKEILGIKGKGEVLALVCDITKDKDIIIAQSNMIYEDYCYTFSDLTELANLLDQVVLKNNDYLAEKRKIAIQYIISQTETENLTFEQLLLDISKKSAQKINLLSVNRQ